MSVKHRIRSKIEGKTKVVDLTHKRAIRAFCEECVGWAKQEVGKCTAQLCPLFPFRTGRGTSSHVPLSADQAEIYL